MTRCMSMRVTTIGARLGFESRLFDQHLEAQTSHHLIEHMIVLIANPARADLQCDMSIAQVITDTRELPGICGANRRYSFRRGQHFDDASILTEQSIAATKHASSLEENRNFFACLENSTQSTLRSQLKGKHESAICSTGGRRTLSQ